MPAPVSSILKCGRFLNCIYGQPATGKTNLCMLEAAKVSKDRKVFFIDTEKSFSPERIKDFGVNLDNILMLQPKTFREQQKAIEDVLKLKDKAGLVIVDSLTMHYRELIQQKQDINPKLSKQLSMLAEIARDSCPVIITSQVYTTMDGSIMPVGGNMVKNWSLAVVKLEQERKRKLTIEKHPEMEQKEARFEINAQSIDLL